jgi:hypothetical protein
MLKKNKINGQMCNFVYYLYIDILHQLRTHSIDDPFKKNWFVYMGERWKQFKTLLSNVYVFGQGDIKEISFSLKLDHDINGLSVYIDKRDLNELSSSIEWLSTSILFLWCA